MKTFLQLVIFFSSTQMALANAVGGGSSVIKVSTETKNCISNTALIEKLKVAAQESAKEDADFNCNSEYPGSKAKGIQRIVEQSIECAEGNELRVRFSAVYFCGG